MEDSELSRLLQEALKKAYNQDIHLLEMQGVEQAFVFRVGVYLSDLLKDTALSALSLDCEYTKNGNDPKRNAEGKGIRPDLIIHERGNNDHNVLALEFKGHWANERECESDKQKLKGLTDQQGEYKYNLGVFVKLCKDKAQCTYFKDGNLEQ